MLFFLFISGYKILDYDGKELTTRQLLDRYFDDPESRFVKDFSDEQMYHNDSNISTINNILNLQQQKIANPVIIVSSKHTTSSPLDLQSSSNNLLEYTSNLQVIDSSRLGLIPIIATGDN